MSNSATKKPSGDTGNGFSYFANLEKQSNIITYYYMLPSYFFSLFIFLFLLPPPENTYKIREKKYTFDTIAFQRYTNNKSSEFVESSQFI